MTKRLILFILIIVITSSLITACGNSNSSGGNGSDTASSLTSSNSASSGIDKTAVSENKQDASSPVSVKPVVSVTAPEGWNKNEGAAAPSYQNGTCTFIVTSDLMPSDAAMPEQFVSYAKGKLKEVFPNAEFKDPEKTTAAGMEAMKLEYSATVSGMKFVTIITYIFKDGYANTFTFGGLSDEVAGKMADLQKFLDSIMFK